MFIKNPNLSIVFRFIVSPSALKLLQLWKHLNICNKNFERKKTFEQNLSGDGLPTYNITKKKINDNISILDLISLTEIKISKSEIRRLISGNGIKINNETISDEKKIINIKFFNEEGFLKLSIGKKKHIKIQLN